MDVDSPSECTQSGAPRPLRVLTSLGRCGTLWVRHLISCPLGVGPQERSRQLQQPDQLIWSLKYEAPTRLIYEHFDHDFHGPILSPDNYPGLRLVLLFRHPLDSLISMFHVFASQGRLPRNDLDAVGHMKLYLRGEWPEKRNPDAMTERLSNTWLLGLPYREVVRRRVVDWIKAGNCLPVRYEDVVADTKRETVRMLDYLRIPYTPETLARCIDRNSFRARSGGRSPGQVDSESHYRRGVPDEWRDVFSEADLALIRDQMGDHIEFLGYPLA